jgi:hypothetical protein
LQSFVLYCLDQDGEVDSAERLTVASLAEAQKIAHERLSNCHRVEVWQGAVCVYRSGTSRGP